MRAPLYDNDAIAQLNMYKISIFIQSNVIICTKYINCNNAQTLQLNFR